MQNIPDIQILTIDIGGSNIKATILNREGDPVADYARMPTPQPSNPENVMDLIRELVKDFSGRYDKVFVGFHGYVRNGVIKTAIILDTVFWHVYDLHIYF